MFFSLLLKGVQDKRWLKLAFDKSSLTYQISVQMLLSDQRKERTILELIIFRRNDKLDVKACNRENLPADQQASTYTRYALTMCDVFIPFNKPVSKCCSTQLHLNEQQHPQTLQKEQIRVINLFTLLAQIEHFELLCESVFLLADRWATVSHLRYTRSNRVPLTNWNILLVMVPHHDTAQQLNGQSVYGLIEQYNRHTT